MFRYIICLFLLANGLLLAQSVPVFDSLQLNFSDTLYFKSAKWNLDSIGLKAIAMLPQPQDDRDRIYLTAHTDAVGSQAYNENLAQKRAKTVQSKLLEGEWTENMIVLQTFGERAPVASNNSESDRSLNRRVRVDFYRPIPFMVLNGKITDPKTDKGIADVQVKVHSKSFVDSLQTNENGDFQLKLPVGTVVGIDVFAKGYFLKTQMMKIKLGMKPVLKIELQKTEIGAAADLSKLYFVGNKAVLLERSKPELAKIKRFFDVNNHLIVEIAGHVNYPNKPPVTKDTFEWDLSVRRAQFLYNWLLENGVADQQLTYKGYGNHEMRFPQAKSNKEQELNRRVEIRIIGEL